MKKEISALLIVFILGTALLWRVSKQRTDQRRVQELQEYTNALAKATWAYTDEHGDHFPNADHWPDQLAPYLPSQYKHYLKGVAMNRALSEQKLTNLPNPTPVVLFFESTQEVSAELDSIPKQTPTGFFAVTWADGHGFAHVLSQREVIIKASKENSSSLR